MVDSLRRWAQSARAVTPVVNADPRLALWMTRPAFPMALVALMTFFILFARRYAQMLDPQVWDEEGLIISQLVEHGPATILAPLNGYLLILPRIITFISMLGPFADYPAIATTLTWAIVIVMLMAIACVPSRLRGGPLLIIATLLVPCNAEVFGLSLYVFWWAIPLLFATYFWTGATQTGWWRPVIVAIAGFSAPAILLTVPLFVFVAFRNRQRSDIVVAAIAIICAVVQYIALHGQKSDPVPATFAIVIPTISKLIGGYLVWNLANADATRGIIALAAGIGTLTFIAVVCHRERSMRDVLFPLAYLWFASLASSVARADVRFIDQVAAGPRYYFLPFVLEGWILVQIAVSARNTKSRAVAMLMLVCAAFNTLPVLSRSHVDLKWKESLAACVASSNTPAYSIPIQGDGNAATHWVLVLSSHECRRLQRFGLAGLLKPSGLGQR